MKKTKQRKSLKLLAPAGDWECLRAAIQAKADCVYLGISNFNMRSTGAKNFEISDLPKISKYCKENRVEAYITVNTVLYNSDLKKMREIITSAKENDFNGVIVSDFAAIEYAHEIDMPMSISTQLSISNIESVRFFAKYANRMILARELSLEQVKEIVKQIEEYNITSPDGELVEIEIFGHGALCVAVSGRCNMSLYCYNSSANKGECTQICRRAYKIEDLETGQELKIDNHYVMSPKDLCTIGMLDKIIDSGVKVLKLEGRGRPPEYVDTVVKTYRKAIDAIGNDSYTPKLIEELNRNLKTVFNRGLSTGLYMGRSYDEWAKGPGNQAKTKRAFVGKVLHYFPKKQVALIKITANITLTEGQECLIIGENTGLVRFKLKNIVFEEKEVKKITQNQQFTIKTPIKVRKNDNVFVIQ
jgi:U32 family peptidase